MATVAPDGRYDSSGKSFWFIPGKFGFCPCCLDQPHPRMRERTKLAGLSGEGRSSATTLLVSTALEWMNGNNSSVAKEKRKLLGFTDNRQDAALQAGHFNDFLFVSLLRGAILRAVLDAGDDGMAEDEFGLRVVKALGFTAGNKDARIYWMLDPEAGAVVREDAQRSLAKVLAHRLWTDLRRGWRYTNPSLSVLRLIDVAFVGLDDIAEDAERLTAILPEFGTLDVSARKAMLKLLLGAMLDGLAVGTESLDLTVLDAVAQKSRNLLRAPWAIDAKETPRSRTTLFLQAPGKDRVGLREEQTIRAGHNSRIGRLINRRSVIGTKVGKTDYLTVITGLMELLAREGLVLRFDIEADVQGWRLSPSAVRIVPGDAIRKGTAQGNRYFHDLYNAIAADLKAGHTTNWGIEGREHTAQVSQRQREWREWRFRFEKEDRENPAENAAELKAAGESEQFLPALFCSPTMELGVDISALNAVYLRNGTVTGVHRTWLARDGTDKAPIATPRRAMGHLLGNGVRFCAGDDVLVVGEGVETVLSLRCALARLPMIAALSANHLAALALPSGLRRLYVARDNDRAGFRAAEALRERAEASGIEALTLTPTGEDFNADLRLLGRTRLTRSLRVQLVPEDVVRFLPR